MDDAHDLRERKLSILGKVSGAVGGFYPVVFVLIILPLLAEGSAYEERAASIQKYFTVGAYIGIISVRWSVRVRQWCERTNRPWDGPWFLGGVSLVVIPATAVGYFLLRLFDHPGQWDIIFGYYSSETLVTAIFFSILIICVNALNLTAVTHYRRGESMVFAGPRAKPASFGQVVFIVLFPLLILIIITLF